MSLYFCVFDGSEEVAGVDVGGYSNFGDFRETVMAKGEGGTWGSRFPTLMSQPDDNGTWDVPTLTELRDELTVLASRSDLRGFVDSENRPLAEALLGLCEVAIAYMQPILFQ